MTIPSRPNWTLALGLPLLVIIACIVVVFSPLFALHASQLSTGVVLDLTVTAPLLYFLAIRRTSVSKMSVIRVFVVGVLVAGLLLSGRSPLLHGIRTWISPVVEAVVLLGIAWKFRRARKLAHDGDFLTRARNITAAVLGNQRAGDVMGSEIAVFYYAMAGRPGPDAGVPADGGVRSSRGATFSYGRASGAMPVLGVFVMALLAEGIGLHFLIAHWSVRVAWILTGLSAYTLLQLFAHMRAIKARPILVEDGMLYLRNGLAADVAVRIADIEEISLTNRAVRGEDALKLALFGSLESHTVRVKLRQPVTAVHMFGIRRQASVLLFAVDRPEELLASIYP